MRGAMQSVGREVTTDGPFELGNFRSICQHFSDFES